MAIRTFFAVLCVLLFVVSIASGDGWFPISTFGIKNDSTADTSWVADVDTAWNDNSTMIGWRRRDPNTISLSEME